ncbi:MAG TPA: hypothetical protein VGL27_11135, partial [Negativicutes bacterium]
RAGSIPVSRTTNQHKAFRVFILKVFFSLIESISILSIDINATKASAVVLKGLGTNQVLFYCGFVNLQDIMPLL